LLLWREPLHVLLVAAFQVEHHIDHATAQLLICPRGEVCLHLNISRRVIIQF
jgi:hypothetical protein